MRKHRAGSVWMILPLYLFTLIFVALPLLYVVALSFSTADGGYGVNWKFTLDNYKQILEPVYLQTFTGSFRLALTSTLIICLVGYPFGYFMAKLSEGKKKLAMLFLMLPFWVNSLIRLYGWIIILQKKGLLNYLLMKLGIIQEPLKILYSYPAIVIGMISMYCCRLWHCPYIPVRKSWTGPLWKLPETLEPADGRPSGASPLS